jgi:hypothetical protein
MHARHVAVGSRGPYAARIGHVRAPHAVTNFLGSDQRSVEIETDGVNRAALRRAQGDTIGGALRVRLSIRVAADG